MKVVEGAATPDAVVSDEDLLEGIRRRDVGALEQLYDRYRSHAFALAYRIAGNREAAEEVLQDAFMSVWKQGATYQERLGKVRPWLLSIVHHRAIDYVRSPSARRSNVALEEAWMRPSDHDVFRDAYGALRREQIVQALAQLPDEQRQAVEMAYFQGLVFTDIAANVGVPVGTVKSRVRLALGKLRQLLDEELLS